jgi:hypothetical protein
MDLFAIAASEKRTLIGKLGDGTPVFSKQGANHLEAHPDVVPLVPEALRHLTLADFVGRELGRAVDMGAVVGIKHCVPTGPDDKIVFRRRRGRKSGCSRFAVGRSGLPCRSVVVRLYRTDSGLVALMTAYVGDVTPAEPNSDSGRTDAAAWKAACEFWSVHALCLEGAKVEPDECSATDFFGSPVE